MANPSDGRSSRRAVQAAETRERLLDAAITAFSDDDYKDVAVADIAKSVGVAHGLLFHYFGSKRGIYQEAMQRAAAQLNESFEIRPDVPPDQQLRDSLTRHLRFLSTHQGLALRLVLGGRGADPESWAVFEDARGRALNLIGRLAGLDVDDPALQMIGRSTVGAIDEATVYWLEHGQPFEVDRMVDFMVEMSSSAMSALNVLKSGAVAPTQ